jgi:enoyl-CoA hydratase
LIDSPFFSLQNEADFSLLRLGSEDGTNRLTQACVLALTAAIRELAENPRPLVITGNTKFFSAGAELEEIAALDASSAYEFSKTGQTLMRTMDEFPVPVYAAISGYCMGGGMDLALACRRRIASPNAVFGHRGAALGLITGWGGTQRLPRLVGKAIALEMFVAAEKISAPQALAIGLVEAVADDPVAEALHRIKAQR